MFGAARILIVAFAAYANAAERAALELTGNSPWLRIDAEVLRVDAAIPPAPDAGWKRIVLPDLEGAQTRGFDADRQRSALLQERGYRGRPIADAETSGSAEVPATHFAWYRFPMPDRKPNAPWSVYLWRFSMNAEAYFNGELIGRRSDRQRADKTHEFDILSAGRCVFAVRLDGGLVFL